MTDCLFCKLVDGKIPSHTVYENERFIAFMDIFPKVVGHTLVIPKAHYRWVYDVPEFEAYWETTRIVTGAIQKALSPRWVNYYTFGAVPHAHIHILPRMEDPDRLTEHTSIVPAAITVTAEELKQTAEKIRAAF